MRDQRWLPLILLGLGACSCNVMSPGDPGNLVPATVAEDFAYFANEIPGFYYRLGTLKPGTTSGNHHTPTFQADDSAIPVGIKAMAYLVWDYLGGTER